LINNQTESVAICRDDSFGKLRLILDNHSAHISKEAQRYLTSRPQRFPFVFVPKHGSWLNLVENMFSKMARSMLREIRVQSKQELIQRIHLLLPRSECSSRGIPMEV
jgi:transposase